MIPDLLTDLRVFALGLTFIDSSKSTSSSGNGGTSTSSDNVTEFSFVSSNGVPLIAINGISGAVISPVGCATTGAADSVGCSTVEAVDTVELGCFF